MAFLFLVLATLLVATVIGILSIDGKLAAMTSGIIGFWLSLLLHLTDPVANTSVNFFWETLILVVGAGLAAALSRSLAGRNERNMRKDLHDRSGRIPTTEQL